jgi:hypothetical protein
MGKRLKPTAIEYMAQGSVQQRQLAKKEIRDKATELKNKMPTDVGHRTVYIRNLVVQTMQKKIELDVFIEFVKMTNSWMEIESMVPRAKFISKGR